MMTIKDLEQAAQQGLALVLAQDDVEEAEVYVSANGVLLSRLNYTSHIPCNGVEEPKSVVNYGIGVQVVFKSPTTGKPGGKIGFGSEMSDISLEGVQSALDKARQGAVEDPEFISLAKPTGEKRKLKDYADPAITDMKDEALSEVGWRVLNGGLRVFETSESLTQLVDRPEKLTELGIIIGGDVTVLQERMAIASRRCPNRQSDESTLVMSFITSMVETEGAKGTGYAASTTLAELTDEAGARPRRTRSPASAACGCRRATTTSSSAARRSWRSSTTS